MDLSNHKAWKYTNIIIIKFLFHGSQKKISSAYFTKDVLKTR